MKNLADLADLADMCPTMAIGDPARRPGIPQPWYWNSTVRQGSVRFNLTEEASPPTLFLSSCTYSMVNVLHGCPSARLIKFSALGGWAASSLLTLWSREPQGLLLLMLNFLSLLSASIWWSLSPTCCCFLPYLSSLCLYLVVPVPHLPPQLLHRVHQLLPLPVHGLLPLPQHFLPDSKDDQLSIEPCGP